MGRLAGGVEWIQLAFELTCECGDEPLGSSATELVCLFIRCCIMTHYGIIRYDGRFGFMDVYYNRMKCYGTLDQ
jgi:hypothetical protein